MLRSEAANEPRFSGFVSGKRSLMDPYFGDYDIYSRRLFKLNYIIEL